MILTPKNSYIRRREMNAVLDCLVEDFSNNGTYRTQLIKQAKEIFNFEYCIALRSPCHALQYALQCCDIHTGDAIGIPALSDSWIMQVISQLGLQPVWIDVDAFSGTIEKESLDKAISLGIKALYYKHPWGILHAPSCLEGISFPIIEDISSAIGSWSKDSEVVQDEETLQDMESQTDQIPPNARIAGSFGTFVLVGLEPGDYFTAGGGMLLYAKARRDAQVLKNFSEKLPDEVFLGDMNAALAMAQLSERTRMQKRRREIMQTYAQSLARSHHKYLVQTADGVSNNAGCIVLASGSVRDIVQYAKKKEVETILAFANSCITNGFVPEDCCPTAKTLALRAIAFPLYPGINKTQAQKIAKVLATMP